MHHFWDISVNKGNLFVTPKKLHAKKEEKLLKRFWDRPLPPQSFFSI